MTGLVSVRKSRLSLRPWGCVAITVEKAGPGEAAVGFHLHSHGRYSHTEAYVWQVLGAARPKPVHSEEEVLRSESGEDVVGFVVMARKME